MAKVKGLLDTSSVDAARGRLQASPLTTPAPVVGGFFNSGNAAAGLGGLQAGQITPGTDPLSSLASIGTATASGALSGGLVGGPVGAAVGGGVGLLTSSLNSWLSVRSENQRKREMDKFIKEVEAKNAKKSAQARKDQLMQVKFNRGDIERNQAISAFTSKRQLLTDAINNNQTLKDRFIQTGVR